MLRSALLASAAVFTFNVPFVPESASAQMFSQAVVTTGAQVQPSGATTVVRSRTAVQRTRVQRVSTVYRPETVQSTQTVLQPQTVQTATTVAQPVTVPVAQTV